MDLTYFAPFILVIEIGKLAKALDNVSPPILAPALVNVPESLKDSKSRSIFGGDTFLENKDGIINMLEAKLKEVRDKKKKKFNERAFPFETGFNNGLGLISPDVLPKCDAMKNLELKLKSNGLSGIGEVGLLLKYGSLGKGFLKMESTGLSNVGKAIMEMEVIDGNIHIPGLSHLFSGKLACDPHPINVIEKNVTILETAPTKPTDTSQYGVQRRSDNVSENSINIAAAEVSAVNGTIATVSPSVHGSSTVSGKAVPVSSSAVLVNTVSSSVSAVTPVVPVSVVSAATESVAG